MKKAASILTAIVMLSAAVTGLPEDMRSGLGTTITADAADVTINATEIQLYALEEKYKDKVSIPSNYAQSFKLKVTGASNVTYTARGGTVNVSEDGTVTTAGSSWSNFGESTITVTAGSTKFTVKATVSSYAGIYADQKIDEYIKKNVKSTMTAKEKIEQACKMAASYNYDGHYSSATSMIIMGGGDCWASTDLIVRFCTKLGYEAWERNANRDPGAGSGHMNAMIYADGKYYQAEAGYTGTAPRYYDITERKTLYSYHGANGGIEVYQYDGQKMPETLEIPSTIDGRKVVSIGDKFALYSEGVKKIIIPDGVTNIGDYAFYRCENLEEVVIPSTVQNIGIQVFNDDQKLTKFTVASGNKYFSSKDGVLYDKNKTTLLYCPAAAEINIPSTVKTIAAYSFYDNDNIEKITIPDSVTETGDEAFAQCGTLRFLTFGKNVTKIGSRSFFGCFCFEEVEIPASVRSIGEYGVGFYYTDDKYYGFTMYVTEGSAAHTFAVENGIKYVIGNKPKKGLVKGLINIHTKWIDYDNPTTYVINSKGESTEFHNSYNDYSVLLEPGEYTVVAEKRGFVTAKKAVTVTAEKTTVLNIDLATCGDLNLDGTVDRIDANLLSRYVAGWDGYDEKIFKDVADLNDDGEVNRIDANILSRCVADWDGYWRQYILRLY